MRVPRHHACQTILPLLLSGCCTSRLLQDQLRRPTPQEVRQQLNPLERWGGIWRATAEPRVGRATAVAVVGVIAMALAEAMTFDPAAILLQAPVAAPFLTSRIIANDHIPKNIDRHSTLLHHETLHLTIVKPWCRLIILILEKASPYSTPPGRLAGGC